MKVIGIVTEYNPFHNGHLYQINKIKEMFPDSLIVIAMSSHYTQRGEISIMNKWNKTQLALNNNVDIVLEIPFAFTNQSADTFAYAALKLLSEMKIDTLVFGSESADKDKLYEASKVQINSKDFDELVKKYMNNGENYPTALSKATKDLTNISISESNDILAISYIKEIIKNDYKIDILPIKRTNAFKDLKEESNIISAYAIREKIKNNENIKEYIPYDLNEYIEKVDYNNFFELLKYKIISEKDNLTKYHLVDEGIDKRIYESVLKSNSYDEFIESVKTKRFTYNKINRILINIFASFTKEDAKKFKKLEYIRILGLSKNGKNYLNSIKKNIDLPIYTKFEKNKMLETELKMTNLYDLITNNNLSNDEIKKHVIIK